MINTKYSIATLSIPYQPLGAPHGIPTVNVGVPIREHVEPPPLALPGSNLSRAINYYADYGGCGWWRMIAPEMLLNMGQRGIINGLTTMVLDERFYNAGIKSVRLQRQATPVQLEFVKFLKHNQAQHNFSVIYEIDDIIFKDDIPNFNRCKVAFEDDNVLRSAVEMMQLSDEISVTCDYMKQYYIEKTNNKHITVIPNYPMKMWMDGHYDEKRLAKNYDKNKKRPRILYAGSGTHIDVSNRTQQNDDFTHIINAIIKSRKDFQWVFVGCFPLPLKPFIDKGEIEYIQWYPLMELWRAYYDTNPTIAYAPLQDCHFNRAKSEIKFLESSCMGVPGTFQNMCTYKNAFSHFKTGDELIDNIKMLTKDSDTYMRYARKSRQYAEKMWLDSHLDEFEALYFTPWGSEARNKKSPTLIRNNMDQKI